MNQTPSKKLTVFAAVLILLAGVFIGGYLVLKSGKISATQLDDILKGKTFDSITCNPDANNPNKDSDEDGLKDWQELQVYGTDACKQDSDTDGYLDGEEIASGYDPTKKAPGDELPGTTPKGPRPLPDNLTKALSSMLSQGISTGSIESLTADGQLLSTSELEKYPALQNSVQQVMAGAMASFEADPIDESKIKIINDNSDLAIQKYAGDAFKAMNPSGKDAPEIPELISILNAMSGNTGEQNLIALIDRYNTAVDGLQTISVPSSLLEIHKEQISILSQLSHILTAAKDSALDPLKGTLAIEAYNRVTQQYTAWLEKLSEVLKSHIK